jgi:hypothetical protein
VSNRRQLLKRFGLTEESYAELLAAQGGGCAICGAPPTESRQLCVDHDHACCPERRSCCGRCVRGLLCSPCNTAVGSMADDPERLEAAAGYVRAARVGDSLSLG